MGNSFSVYTVYLLPWATGKPQYATIYAYLYYVRGIGKTSFTFYFELLIYMIPVMWTKSDWTYDLLWTSVSNGYREIPRYWFHFRTTTGYPLKINKQERKDEEQMRWHYIFITSYILRFVSDMSCSLIDCPLTLQCKCLNTQIHIFANYIVIMRY